MKDFLIALVMIVIFGLVIWYENESCKGSKTIEVIEKFHQGDRYGQNVQYHLIVKDNRGAVTSKWVSVQEYVQMHVGHKYTVSKCY